MLTSGSPDLKTSHSRAITAKAIQDDLTASTRYTSVIRHQDTNSKPPPHAINHYGIGNGIPAPPYMDMAHRPRHATTPLGYQPPPQNRPLPPIYAMDRTPMYASQHLDSRNVPGRQVHATTSASPTTLPSPQQTSSAHTNKLEKINSDSNSNGGNEHASNKSTKNISAARVSRLSKSNSSNSVDRGVDFSVAKSEAPATNYHADMVVNSHYNPAMYINGFQPPQFNPHMMAGMPYAPGHPGLPREYGYPPPHPVHMVRAPNGQVFYRYAQPRMTIPPLALHYQVSNTPMQHPLPFMPGQTPVTPYAGYPPTDSMPSAASPKRKRKKMNGKAVIESHSAVLAGTDNKSSVSPSNNVLDSSKLVVSNYSNTSKSDTSGQ